MLDYSFLVSVLNFTSVKSQDLNLRYLILRHFSPFVYVMILFTFYRMPYNLAGVTVFFSYVPQLIRITKL